MPAEREAIAMPETQTYSDKRLGEGTWRNPKPSPPRSTGSSAQQEDEKISYCNIRNPEAVEKISPESPRMGRNQKAGRYKSFYWNKTEVILFPLCLLLMILIIRILYYTWLNDTEVALAQSRSELKHMVEKLQGWEAVRGLYEYCPEGWRPWRGKCYFVSSEVKNQSSSLQDCTFRGAHLALLENPRDLGSMTSSVKGTYWVGLTYIDKRWMWLNGTESRSPVHVRDNSPCAVLTFNGLFDWNCDYPNPWICEKPAVQLQIDQDQNLPVILINGVKLANVTNVKLQT
ncbi:killer cell lectin-like receptor subfamily B member 1B allele C [Rhinatrema bivittatum]|uniref:killer cell lectin-like receptor subfamily B member 1B allele C n=1 Tax=Rhinatrema bivittatum TaxID=194408 RepID=UPI00112EF60F|nr:killer cell lectin-like receptor subfamily B member 1B allele C [Rhinatrema bivittatum]